MISRWSARFYRILQPGGLRTLQCEKQVRHCAYDVGVRRARARARAPYASIISTIGVPFLRLCRYASFQIARFQRITEPPPEPSLCASEVPLMLLMRSSSGLQNHVKITPYRCKKASFKLPSNRSALLMPSRAPLTRTEGPMMEFVGGSGATPESKL